MFNGKKIKELEKRMAKLEADMLLPQTHNEWIKNAMNLFSPPPKRPKTGEVVRMLLDHLGVEVQTQAEQTFIEKVKKEVKPKSK